MPTKAKLEQQLKQRTQELEAAKTEYPQLQRTCASVLRAVQVSKEDLDRALQPVTLSHETGWELAERYEQSLKQASKRLSALCSALSLQSALNLLDPLWQPLPKEDEQLSGYFLQSAELSEEDLAQ